VKVIAYSLFGSNPRYSNPLIITAKNINVILPGWVIWVYYDSTVPKNVVNELTKLKVSLIHMDRVERCNWAPKFWRFLPVFEREVDVVLFRDSDSIITSREASLVNYWIDSDYSAQILRDHPLHMAPIMAGMFGLKKEVFEVFAHQLELNMGLVQEQSYSADQVFLAKYLYKVIYKKAIVQTPFFSYPGENCLKIPEAKDENFIGAVYESEKIEAKIAYDFLIGIPFWIAELLQFKTRPVLYTSIYLKKLNYCLYKSYLIR
jgi:hypothetical protein